MMSKQLLQKIVGRKFAAQKFSGKTSFAPPKICQLLHLCFETCIYFSTSWWTFISWTRLYFPQKEQH